MHTVFDFAAKRAALSPDAIAFEDADSGRRLTFAAFNERAEQGAAALEQMRFVAGERVAILCHNTSLFFEVLFACAKARLVLVPLNWRRSLPIAVPGFSCTTRRRPISPARWPKGAMCG